MDVTDYFLTDIDSLGVSLPCPAVFHRHIRGLIFWMMTTIAEFI